MKGNGVILYLTQNNPVRRTYLKTSLYFLFRNFNSTHKYPVLICHEGDYDVAAINEIMGGIRHECKHLVRFQKLDDKDFEVPDGIDMDRVNRSIEAAPVPYWRNLKYRLMCRWWLRMMPNYVKDFDYVMRLDDDSIIEEPLAADIIGMMKEKELVYQSNLVHVDCGLCNYGLSDIFSRHSGGNEGFMKQFFQASKIPYDQSDDSLAGKINGFFRDYEPLVYENAKKTGEINLQMPIMFYNNFFVSSVAFWTTPEVLKLLDEIDKTGGIFYYRWGDAPIQSLIVGLLCDKSKILKTTFKYSKRLQREAFVDDTGGLQSYMPASYSESSCATER